MKDCLGNPPQFLKLLQQIYHNFLLNQKTHSKVYHVKHCPLILFWPRFGGWDPIIENYVYNFGDRVVYADWAILGFLNQIDTQGDIFENYAQYLERFGVQYGSDNHQTVKSIMNFVHTHKVDGIIYNQLFGCHSLCTSYYRLRKELMKEEIPSTLISFNTVGENREQVKTRIAALMELIKNK